MSWWLQIGTGDVSDSMNRAGVNQNVQREITVPEGT
jgi:hypothetical protein